MELGWHAVPLEPVQAIVGERGEVEERQIRGEVLRGDFPERVGLFELPDDELGPGPVVVEAPEGQGSQRQVGHEDLVGEPAELEKVELPRGLLGGRAADHHEAAAARPPLGLVRELGGRHRAGDPDVAQGADAPLDRGGEARDDDVARLSSLQPLDDLVVEEGGVGADPDLANGGGQLRPALFEERQRDRRHAGVARVKTPGPHVQGRPVEAEEGQVGGAPALLRVEPDRGLLLAPVNRQDRRIEVEEGARLRGGTLPQRRPVPVVEASERAEPSFPEAAEEAAQGRGLRVTAQPHEILEHPVALERLGSLDPPEAENQGVE